ncbi:MAG: CocE/NonD family hydrolase [Candidatus Thorarchaeota archaeon]|nr:CocE/NonD family hydrolase [Candidatus Thorarchaeota archaeon]
MKMNFALPVEMRDGIKLSTILYVPQESGNFTTVLIRTPYSAKGYLAAVDALRATGAYAIVLQDTRGRYDSEGLFTPFKEKEDTLDTISWIKKQDWSNGRFIAMGPSYLGYVALQVLDDEGDSIDAIFSPMTFTRPYDGLVYRNGVLHLHWALPWSIMTSTRVQSSLARVNGTWPENYSGALPDKVDSLGWPDHVWQQFLNPKATNDWLKDSVKISKPLKTRVCLVGGWFDFMLGATFSTFEDVMSAGGQPPDLILGPWGHNGYLQSLPGLGDFDFGKEGKANAAADFMGMVKRTVEGASQYIKAYILRKDEWITLDSWPPSEELVETQLLHLDTGFTLNLEPPKKESEFDIHVDPSNPVPTIGGAVWEFPPLLEPGPADQSQLSERRDVLRFFGEPATDSYTILGPITAKLWVTSESPETHFTTKMLLEDKDGNQRFLQDGIVSVKGRLEDYTQIRVDMLAIGIQIEKTERIGFEVSWSNFPKYELPQISGPSLQSVKSSVEQPSFFEISVLR